MKIEIEGIEREATIIPLPKSVYFFEENSPRPWFGFGCVLAPSITKEEKERGGEFLAMPLFGSETGFASMHTTADIREDVEGYDISHVCKYADFGYETRQSAVREALSLWVQHGTPITKEGRDAIIKVIGIEAYQEIIGKNH